MQGKVDPGQHHKDNHHHIDIGAVKTRHRGVLCGEPARGHGGEGVAQGIEQRHAAGAQQDGLRQVQGQVNPPEPDHRIPVARYKFFSGNHLTGARLRPEYPQPTNSVRQEEDGEREKAHAAQEMGLAPPEQQAVWDGLDVLEDGGAGRGEAGDRLEHGVDRRQTGEDVGDGADHADHGGEWTGRAATTHEPLADNSTVEGMRRNRRVEITILEN